MPTKELTFPTKIESAIALIESVKTLTVRSDQEYAVAKERLEDIRAFEKELEKEYKEHPLIVEAKRIQGLKGELADKLESARKGLKNGPMLQYEQEQEAKRQAEERRIQAELKAKADKEAAELADIERKKAEAARKEFERAKKKGDEEAAALAKKKQDEAKAEAARIKEDAKNAPAPTVVIEKTAPAVNRRTIWKFRIISEHLVPRQYLKVDEVKIGGVVRSLKGAVQIPGVQAYEEPA